MELLQPRWPGANDAIGALASTRRGGFSTGPYADGSGGGGLNLGSHVGDNPADVARNRARLSDALPAAPVWLDQVHGTTVIDAAQAVGVPRADASFTTRRGVVCAILTADCLPVLFADRQATVVGAAHAGWRGLAAGVLQNTVAAMRNAGAGEIEAWLGPAIGPRQFEVGEDVLAAFAGAEAAFSPVPGKPGKYLADIYRLARLALAAAEVRQTGGGDLCTVSEPTRFYSYRRDGVTGRMASLVWLR